MHRTFILGAALLPLTATITGCGRNAEAAEQANAETAASIVVRAVGRDARQVVVAASGTIEARASADVAFQVPGKVVAVRVEEGQRVGKGQLLALLDATEYSLAYTQARLSHERNTDEAQRARALESVNGIAANDLDKLNSAEKLSFVNAALAEKHLLDTRLTAPLSGTIARRVIDAGENVAAGAPAFTIVDLDVVHVRVAVPESDVGSIVIGQPATIAVPSLGGQTFDGKVRLVGVAADRATRTYAVEIAVPNPGHTLKAGMIAEATIRTPRKVERLTVPGAAVVRDPEGATRLFVFSADEQRVHARRVDVIGMHGTDVEVNGVTDGDLVVVGGQHRLREGMLAKPTNAEMLATGSAGAPNDTPAKRGASRGSL